MIESAIFIRTRLHGVGRSTGWSAVRRFLGRRLWHQMTVMLLEFVNNPAFATGDDLIQMYNSFLKPVQNKLNQLTLVKIAIRVAQQYLGTSALPETYSPVSRALSRTGAPNHRHRADVSEKMVFLSKISEDVAKTKEAQLVCSMGTARFHPLLQLPREREKCPCLTGNPATETATLAPTRPTARMQCSACPAQDRGRCHRRVQGAYRRGGHVARGHDGRGC
jgi:hypothetical protein